MSARVKAGLWCVVLLAALVPVLTQLHGWLAYGSAYLAIGAAWNAGRLDSRADINDHKALRKAALKYLRLTNGGWIGGACGYQPPQGAPFDVQSAWHALHDAAWGSDYRGAKA